MGHGAVSATDRAFTVETRMRRANEEMKHGWGNSYGKRSKILSLWTVCNGLEGVWLCGYRHGGRV